VRPVLALAVAALTLAVPQSATPPVQSPGRPILEFNKTRFLVGERVFFWVGLDAQDPVPRELQDTYRITLTRPDGSVRIEKLGFPIDGLRFAGSSRLSFKGGASLDSETPQVGTWTAVVEFAGNRTQPIRFTVEDLPLLRNIDVTFMFSSPLVLDSNDAFATLTVRNRSSEIIRFVELGQNGSHISGNLNKTTGERWGSSFFVPEEMLRVATGHKIVPMSVDKFTWAATKQFPTVTVRAGAEFQLRLPVAKVMASLSSPIPAGDYDLTFATELQLLVGEANGEWAEFAPIRLMVRSATKAKR
jgi:hypothetical protein